MESDTLGRVKLFINQPPFLSECGVKNPSWLELSHFIKFLDIQLSSCENSVFCNEDHVGDVMPGMRSFVVEFMIRMSKVSVFANCMIHGILLC